MGRPLKSLSTLSDDAVTICDCSGLPYQARKLGQEPSECCFGFTSDCQEQVNFNSSSLPDISKEQYFTFYQPRLDTTEKDQARFFTYIIFPVKGSISPISNKMISYNCTGLIEPDRKSRISFELQDVQFFGNKHLLLPFIINMKKTPSDKYRCELSLTMTETESYSATLFINN